MKQSKPITFTGIFLSKDNEYLKISEFKDKFEEYENLEIKGEVVHTYSFHFDRNYLKIVFSDGSSLPRNPNVINLKTQQPEPNPRLAVQVEPKEHFALIDFHKSLFWISDGRKRNVLLDLMKSKFKNSQIVAKDVFRQTEFIEKLKRLDDLRLAATPNLFSKTTTISKALSDEINQYEAVTAILHLKYQDKLVGNSLSKKIMLIFNNKNNYDDIMISGRDEKNIGMLFNSNEFSRKIEIDANLDEDEMFDPEDVFIKLIKRIEDEKH